MQIETIYIHRQLKGWITDHTSVKISLLETWRLSIHPIVRGMIVLARKFNGIILYSGYSTE